MGRIVVFMGISVVIEEILVRMRNFFILSLIFVFGNLFCQNGDVVRNQLNSKAEKYYPNVVKIISTTVDSFTYEGFGIIIGEIN